MILLYLVMTEFLEVYKINGVPKLSIISIPTISTAIHSIIVTIFIVITAPILFNVEINFNPLV